MISKYYIAAILYIIGMFVCIWQMVSDEVSMEHLRKGVFADLPFSKKANCTIVVIGFMIAAVLWPYCWFKDVVNFIKRESR